MVVIIIINEWSTYPQLLQKRNLIVGTVDLFILGGGIVDDCVENSSECLLENSDVDFSVPASFDAALKYDCVRS